MLPWETSIQDLPRDPSAWKASFTRLSSFLEAIPINVPAALENSEGFDTEHETCFVIEVPGYALRTFVAQHPTP
jgi:hypothetical protein